MGEMKKRYDTVNEKLWNLAIRLDTMSKGQVLVPYSPNWMRSWENL